MEYIEYAKDNCCTQRRVSDSQTSESSRRRPILPTDVRRSHVEHRAVRTKIYFCHNNMCPFSSGGSFYSPRGPDVADNHVALQVQTSPVTAGGVVTIEGRTSSIEGWVHSEGSDPYSSSSPSWKRQHWPHNSATNKHQHQAFGPLSGPSSPPAPPAAISSRTATYERGNYSPADHSYVRLYKRDAPTLTLRLWLRDVRRDVSW